MAAHEWTKIGLTAVGATVAFMIGLSQYASTSSLEVRKPFLEKQMDLCIKAAEHAARLATSRNPETWTSSREEFWTLYYGPLAVVEEAGTPKGKRVTAAMVAFGDKLKASPATPADLPTIGLGGLALDISHACRDLLASKWEAGIRAWLGWGEPD